MLVCSDEPIWRWIILQKQYLLIPNALLWFFRWRLKFKWRYGKFHVGWAFQNHVNIPAGHHTILITCSNDSWHLIIVLGVSEYPCDRFNMISFHCSNIHCPFCLIISRVKNFEASIANSNAYFILWIYTYFANTFLVELFLACLPNSIGNIIIKYQFVICDKYYIVLHRFGISATTQALFVKKHNLFNFDYFVIVQCVAAEGFDEYFLLVIPQTKCIILIDDANPLFDWMNRE